MLYREARVYHTKNMILALRREDRPTGESLNLALRSTGDMIRETLPHDALYAIAFGLGADTVLEYLQGRDTALVRLADQKLRSEEEKGQDARLFAFYASLGNTSFSYIKRCFTFSREARLTEGSPREKMRWALTELLYGKRYQTREEA